ncbi:MAG: hypothetical protein AB8B97_08370 [Granulosicoccus sp.]
MSQNKDQTDEEANRRLAMLGLAISEPGTAQGDRPDMAELWDFMHGAVSEARRAEILSHLAEDEELFSDWQNLQTTALEVEQVQIADGMPPDGKKDETASTAIWQGLTDWFFHNRWISAGGLAAAIALLVIGTLDQRPPAPENFWQDWSQPISSQSAAQDSVLRDELDAVLAGVRSQLIELSYAGTGPSQEPLPENAPPCQNDDALCKERRAALFTLGGLAIDQLSQCQTKNAIPSEFLPDLQFVAGIVRSHPPLAILATPLNRWVQAAEQDALAACDAAALVISGALPIE